ncbi:hypothetical protein Dimus_013731, partial [Dionaea muscipula]
MIIFLSAAGHQARSSSSIIGHQADWPRARPAAGRGRATCEDPVAVRTTTPSSLLQPPRAPSPPSSVNLPDPGRDRDCTAIAIDQPGLSRHRPSSHTPSAGQAASIAARATPPPHISIAPATHHRAKPSPPSASSLGRRPPKAATSLPSSHQRPQQVWPPPPSSLHRRRLWFNL